MRISHAFLLLMFVSLCASPVSAQTSSPKSNGDIVERAAFVYPAYGQLPDALKRAYEEKAYERAINHSGFECYKVKYMSNGLRVVGYIYKPKKLQNKKYPAIIYNRGGVGEVSKIGVETILRFQKLATQGFVVLASQYRGNDGGEGKDEFGGADVNDVLNLVPLARSLGYVDMSNVFMYGVSRGGMMTFLAIKNNVPISAAATVGATTDFSTIEPLPPQAVERLKNLWPDYEKREEEHKTSRSAVRWAERINIPIMIIHGGADRNVSARQTLELARALQEQNKVYELVIYAGDDHLISVNREDAERRLLQWFKKHMK